MRTLDMSTEAAEQLLVRLAAQLPVGVDFGRPALVMPDTADALGVVVTAGAMWWVYPDRADRLTELPGGIAELTTYAGGAELARKFGPVG